MINLRLLFVGPIDQIKSVIMVLTVIFGSSQICLSFVSSTTRLFAHHRQGPSIANMAFPNCTIHDATSAILFAVSRHCYLILTDAVFLVATVTQKAFSLGFPWQMF